MQQTIQRLFLTHPGLKYISAHLTFLLLQRCINIDPILLKRKIENSLTGGLDWLWLILRRPIISVLIPVFNTEPEMLTKAILSVKNQIFRRWELCIVDDASSKTEIKTLLKNFAVADRRIKLHFARRNEGIAATCNKALKMASGKYIGVLDHDDILAPNAIWEYFQLMLDYPKADLIYSDEDKIDEQGKHCHPWHKSDWNPDLSLSHNYVMHFAVYRRSLVEQIGGFHKQFEGSQDYDLLLRATEITNNIHHMPLILYHWRMSRTSLSGGCPEVKPYVFINGLAAVQDMLKRRGIDGIAEDAPNIWKGVYRVKRKIHPSFSCSIIVLYAGDQRGLERLLESLSAHAPKETLELLLCSQTVPKDILIRQTPFDLKWIDTNASMSISTVFNRGVQAAQGDFILFLDETMELIDTESCLSLIEQIQRPEVGVTGGKVYYQNGLVEHAGVILGPFELLGYSHRATPDDPGYYGIKNSICNYSAVMGLGMMTRRNLFIEMGGFDELFERYYHDVDYCLRLGQRRYLCTYTPYAQFRHHIPIQAIHEMVVEPDASRFKGRWLQMIEKDPFFNPHFSRQVENFHVAQ